jgi:glucose/arabinose dehydrogenase
MVVSDHTYYLRVFRLWVLLLTALVSVGCQKDNPSPPSPGPGPGTGETITGRERLGWDQPAGSTSELASYQYAIYVDDVRGEMSEITCGSTAGPNGYSFSGRLPALSPGARRLQLATFVTSNGAVLESTRSAALQVTVTGVSSPVDAVALQDGETLITTDGLRLETQLVADGFDEPADLAVAEGGRFFVAQQRSVLILHGDRVTTGLSAEGTILSIALDPQFDRTGHVYVVEAIAHENGPRFRTSRYRELGGRLVERMVLLPEFAASDDPHAVLRFGPEGKLFAAFDNGGSADAAIRLSDWNGKVLRLEPDGRTPADQPSASPVLVSALASPRGLAWTPDAETMWLAEAGADGIERLKAVAMSADRPRRAGQRASYALPDRVGLASMAVHSGHGAARFAGDLFVAAREGAALLRVRFEQEDRRRVVTTERLLEGRVGPVHAVAVDTDGSLVLATARQLWRLVPRQ